MSRLRHPSAYGTAPGSPAGRTSQTQNTSYFSGTSFPVEKSGANLTGGANAVVTNDSGNVWVQIGSYTGNATYASGSTPTSVANTLASALTANSQANASVVTISSSQARIDLSAKQVGVAGNSMQWAGGATSNQPGLFNPPSIRPSTASGNFSGGADEVLPQPNGIFSLDTPLITNYTYDALDNLTCVEQRGRVSGSGCAAAESSDATSPWRVRRFTYNSLGQLLSAKNPESGLITFTYDDDGNMKSKTSPAPNQLAPSTATQTISHCYDVLHRMTKKFFISNPVCTDTAPITFFYDQTSHNGLTNITNGIGRRTGMNDQSGATAWKYDEMGRPLTERRTIDTITKETNYTYNFDGSLKSVSSPGTPAQVVEYSYNATGRAVAASEGSISYVSAVKYTPAGVPCSLTNDASIVSTFTFNSRLQPVRMHATTTGAPATPCGSISGTGTILDFEYNFNAGTANNGNVIGITNNRNTARSQAFTYDELNRLKTAQTTSNLWGNSYVYDPWGNLLQKNSIAGKLESELLQATVNGKNQMETSYCYDIAGNLVKQAVCPVNPLAIDYTYDEENQLETALGVTYTYDGDGKRVKKSNGTLYWYGVSGQIFKETDLAGNNPKDYIFFKGKRVARRDSATIIHYYFSDHLGSSNVVTNKTGLTIEEESDFYPFGGERIVTNTLSDQNYKFTGKERDTETNLDYFGARYYGSSFGRFITTDPLDASAHPANPQSWNRYTYAFNNPIAFVDIEGKCSAPAIGQGQVGICVSLYISSERVKVLGGGDGRGPTPNDKKATYRAEIHLVADPAKGSVTMTKNDAGTTHAIVPVPVSIIPPVVAPVSVSAKGTSETQVSQPRTDSQGTTHFNVSNEAKNGLAEMPLAPKDSIKTSIDFQVTNQGEVGIEGGVRTAYPSLEVWSYDSNGNATAILQIQETKIEDLKRQDQPIPAVKPR